MKNNTSLYLLLIAFLVFYSCNDDTSEIIVNPDPITTEADLVSLFTGEVVGSSELVRSESLIKMTVVANNLIPGHVYNLTCSVYNKPENCEGDCDPEDFEDRNVEVEAVGFLMSGKQATSTTETFTATLRERDISSYPMNPYAARYGDHGGLQDAQKATIDLYIRSQGPAQTGTALQDQLTTLGEACSFISHSPRSANSRIPEEVGECAFIYESQHIAP